jgi:hypothetical protein
MDIAYFLRHARAVDILDFLDKNPQFLSLFVSLREHGEVEAAAVGGKPIQLNPDEVRI